MAYQPGLEPTRDHVIPRSLKGNVTVWACFICNMVKRDMTPEQWAWYRREHPEWWLGGRAQKALLGAPTLILKKRIKVRGAAPEKPSTPMADQLRALYNSESC